MDILEQLKREIAEDATESSLSIGDKNTMGDEWLSKSTSPIILLNTHILFFVYVCESMSSKAVSENFIYLSSKYVPRFTASFIQMFFFINVFGRSSTVLTKMSPDFSDVGVAAISFCI